MENGEFLACGPNFEVPEVEDLGSQFEIVGAHGRARMRAEPLI